MEWVLLVVAAVVAYILWSRRSERVDHAAQEAVERIATAQILSHPSLSDADILQLIRDVLHDQHARDPALFRWASLETVGRVRRNLIRGTDSAARHVAAIESAVRPPKAPPSVAGKPRTVVFDDRRSALERYMKGRGITDYDADDWLADPKFVRQFEEWREKYDRRRR